MFVNRNFNVVASNALAVTYSTLTGNITTVSSLITISSLSTAILRTTGFTGSTLSGSTITTTTLTASTVSCSTITSSAMYLSTLLTSTLGVGSSFVITNGSTTGTASAVPQYPLDVSGTIRTSALQYYDNSVTVSEQTPLNYNVLGQTWTHSIALTAAWTAVAVSANGQYQVACVSGGSIWYSSTYGQTWTSANTSSLSWTAIAISGSGQFAVAAATSGSIWYSSNYGQTWTSSGATSSAWVSIAISVNGQFAAACVSSGALWYSSNYGQTWTASATAGTTALAWSSIAMSATGQYVYACVNGASIWYSNTYGQTWISTGVTSSAWSSIAVSENGQYATACVNSGLLWYSTNYGQTWTSVGTTNTWSRIIMSASGQYQLATTTIPSLLYNYRFNVGDMVGATVLNYATGQYDGALMNSATITTASYKTGSGSLSLVPTYSQYVNLPPFTMSSAITGITFSCWINLNSSTGMWARIFDMSRALKGTTFSNTSYSFLCGYTPGVLNFYTGTETNSSQSSLGHYSTPYTPSTGTWTHLAWVLTSSSWTIYINGSAVTPSVVAAVTQYLPPNGAYPYFFIGRSSWISDVYANGNFNDFRMYTSALNASQVSAIYNSGNGIIGSQIVSTNFGASWTNTAGAQGNWSGLAMSSTGQYITGCINSVNNSVGGSTGILTSVTPVDSITVSNVSQVTENTTTTMATYGDGSVSQIAQGPLGPLDYNTFGQTWTRPAINKTIASTPLVAVSGTGQTQAVATNPVALTPATIMSGLQLWYDAADPNGTGVTPGAGTLSTWVDKSGNGRNAAVTGTFTIIPNSINGLPVVSMTNNANTATNYALASVNAATAFPNFFNVISVYRSQGTVTYSVPWAYTNDGVGNLLDQYGSTRYFTSGSATNSAYTIGATTNTVLVTQLMNTSGATKFYTEYLNGSTTASLNVQIATAPNATQFSIATRASDRFTTFFGHICEIIAYNTQMSTANQQVLEGYLAWKWGIQGNLPAGHPYKFINPLAPTSVPFSLTSGLQLWLDASTLNVANGAVVSSWPTVAGTPYTFTSSNATYLTNIQNGLGVVSFAAGQSGSIPNFVLGQTQTIFMLTYAVGQTTSAVFLEHSPTIDGNAGFLLWTGNSENYVINSGSSRIAVSGGNITVANTWLLLEGMNPDSANSNQMSFYLNGAFSATGTTQSGTTTVTNTLYFNNSSRVSQPSYLAEILIYNVALTATQRQQVEAYLMFKWGLQGNLPAGHSFRAFHPSNTIVSTNYGQTWIVAAISASNWASMASSINGQNQVACINGGSIWYSSTSGSVWLPSSASLLSWSSISLSGSGQYATACVNGGAIWYSSNYGQTWTQSNSGSFAWSCIIMSTSGEYQFAGHSTSSGGIMISTNYGQTWVLITGTTFGTIRTICCSASGKYVYVGSSTGIYYSVNYGISWVVALFTTTQTWSSMECTASGQYLIATDSATSGSVYVSTNYGQTWTIVSNTAYTCGGSALSASGQYMLLATPSILYQAVTRIASISLAASSQHAITYPASSYIIGSPSYLTLPGGIILQTGSFNISVVVNAQSSLTVTFPKPFPTVCSSVVLSMNDTGPGSNYTTRGVMPQLITTANFLCMMKYVAGSVQSANTITIYWQAVGY